MANTLAHHARASVRVTPALCTKAACCGADIGEIVLAVQVHLHESLRCLFLVASLILVKGDVEILGMS